MNSTNYYELSQIEPTDKPTWLVMYNSDMLKIDTGIHEAKTTADGAVTAAAAAQSTADTATSNLATLSGTVGNLASDLATVIGNINTINSLIGNGTPTTTDKTLIGAINELDLDIGALAGDVSDLTPTLLWSNSDPTSDFAEQIVTLSEAFTHFEFLEIFYAQSNGTYQGSTKIKCASGGSSELKDIALTASLVQLRTRSALPNDTNKITFGDGYVCNLSSGATGGTVNNAMCVPLEVYGIK